MNQSPRLYALANGAPLLEARLGRGWTQRELARRASTSHATIAKLEGTIGHATSAAIAGRIAAALELELDDLFTAKAPPASAIGGRARPPGRRYDGTHTRDEAQAWRDYLERVADKPIFEWTEKLSAQRATKRISQLLGFSLTPTRLAQLARSGRVRSETITDRGLGPAGVGYLFDEAELAADLAALEPCAESGCDRPAVCESGGCPEHSRVLQLRGRPRSPEAIAKTAAAKRGVPRPEAAARMQHLHALDRIAFERQLAPTEIGTKNVAELYGVARHTVLAHHVPYGLAKPTRVIGGALTRRLVFEREETLAFRLGWLRRGPEPHFNFALAWLDPDHVVAQAKGSGRLQLLARRLGVDLDEAEAIERARVGRRRKILMPHRRGAKKSSRAAHWAETLPVARAELEAERSQRIELGLEDDGPVSDYAAAGVVAERDAQRHPNDWRGYLLVDGSGIDPRQERAAADRVLTAVKRLQIA